MLLNSFYALLRLERERDLLSLCFDFFMFDGECDPRLGRRKGDLDLSCFLLFDDFESRVRVASSLKCKKFTTPRSIKVFISLLLESEMFYKGFHQLTVGI